MHEFAEGFKYLSETPSLGMVILMLALISLLVLPFSTVFPVFAKVIFKGDASTYGYITSFVGVGGVLGTIFLASRRPGARLKWILWACTLLMGAGLIGFGVSHHFALAMVFAAIAGFGAIAQFTISNIVIQSDTDPQMRGRVIGILLMAIFGMLPLGSVLVGAVSQRVGAPATIVGEGVISVLIALVFTKWLTARTQKVS
jgi:predicted MFS family arabinose efflux permease